MTEQQEVQGAAAADDSPRARASRAMFAGGAPEVGIGGLTVARSILQQQDDEGAPSEADRSVTWRIYGHAPGVNVTRGSGPPLIVFGDLVVRHHGWLVGATSAALIAFKDAKAWLGEDETNKADAMTVLGPWLLHVLYDTAATAARGLLVANSAPPIEIPSVTPEAVIDRD